MHFDSFSDFLAMGGYAVYVWSAFGITFIAMILLLVSSLRRKNQLLQEIRTRIDRQARLEAAKNLENTL